MLRLGRCAVVLSSIGALAPLVIFLAVVVRGCVVPDRTAKEFVADLRAGRVAEAGALATPELRPSVLALTADAPSSVPADDRLRTLQRFRHGTRVEEVGGLRRWPR